MKVAVAGPTGYASFKIRAAMLAKATGWDLIDCRQPPTQRYDVIWLVKRHLSQPASALAPLREACDRFIVDPIDWVASPSRIKNVPQFWRDIAAALDNDDWIATSPACAATMAGSGPRIHMLPHQSDHRIDATWYNPDGPIVYCGLGQFIDSAKESIIKACTLIGRECKLHYSGYNSWETLRGAALQLCFRLPPHDGPFERNCRSQIKLANSAAAGIPAICCGTEAELSLWPEVDWLHEAARGNAEVLAKWFQRTITREWAMTSYTLTDFAADARRVIESAKPIIAEPWA